MDGVCREVMADERRLRVNRSHHALNREAAHESRRCEVFATTSESWHGPHRETHSWGPQPPVACLASAANGLSAPRVASAAPPAAGATAVPSSTAVAPGRWSYHAITKLTGPNIVSMSRTTVHRGLVPAGADTRPATTPLPGPACVSDVVPAGSEGYDFAGGAGL